MCNMHESSNKNNLGTAVLCIDIWNRRVKRSQPCFIMNKEQLLTNQNQGLEPFYKCMIVVLLSTLESNIVSDYYCSVVVNYQTLRLNRALTRACVFPQNLNSRKIPFSAVA